MRMRILPPCAVGLIRPGERQKTRPDWFLLEYATAGFQRDLKMALPWGGENEIHNVTARHYLLLPRFKCPRTNASNMALLNYPHPNRMQLL